MDLRIVKTREQIRDAFLTLRDRFSPEKIKVKDICRIAMINKTTFYKYYEDSFALTEEIENGAVDVFLSNFREQGRFFDAPKQYLSGMYEAFEKTAATLRVIFRDRFDVFCSKIERRLRQLYGEASFTPREEVAFSVVTGGFIKLLCDRRIQQQFDKNTLTEQAHKMLLAVMA